MSIERELLTPAVVVAAVAGVLAAAVSLAAGGLDALIAACVGCGLVLAFLLAGQLPLATASRGHGGLGALLLVGGYVARIVLLLVALYLVLHADLLDRKPLGVTVMVTAGAWTVGAVWALVRWRPMYVDPGAGRDVDPGLTGENRQGHR
jgi:hypothetical protein